MKYTNLLFLVLYFCPLLARASLLFLENKHTGKKDSFQLKYYPSRNHSVGIVQSGIGHYFEAVFEGVDGLARDYFSLPDNTFYHMHEGNAINYLNN